MTEAEKINCTDALKSGREDEFRSTLMPERSVARLLRNRALWCRRWATASFVGIAICIIAAIVFFAITLTKATSDDALDKVIAENNHFQYELDEIKKKLDGPQTTPATVPTKEDKQIASGTLDKTLSDYNKMLKEGLDSASSPFSARNLPTFTGRIGVAIALFFLAKILVPLQQRYERLSSLHDSQADVLQLVPLPDEIPLEGWLRLFPVDVLEFSKAPDTPADLVVNAARDIAIAAVNTKKKE